MADDRALAERVGARVEPAAGHAVERLGWEPRYSTDEMFADSYDWFCAHRREATVGLSASHHRRSASSRLLDALKFLSRRLP